MGETDTDWAYFALLDPTISLENPFEDQFQAAVVSYNWNTKEHTFPKHKKTFYFLKLK